jgi:type I restriction enzyme S subunit
MEVKPGYKQTEVGVIPVEWDVFKLSDHFQIYAGGDVPKHSVSNFRSENHPYPIFANALQNRGLYGFTNERRAKADSMTVTARGYLGHAEYRDEPFFPIVRLLVLEPSGALDAKFTTFAVNERVKFAFESTGVPQLTAPQVGQYSVAAPPLPEQRAIAEALSDVDGLLGGLDRLIAKKRDLKQAAMQQLLTGQTRLPGFDGEWEVMTLGEVATFFKGKGLPKSALIPDGAEPCVHYGELFTRYPETIGEIFSRTNGSRDSFRSVANDVLMPTSDVTPRGLAKASCVTVDGVILGGDILVIRSDTRRVFGSFLSYIIRREEDQVLRLVTGSTVYHLYGSDMKKFTLALPPLPEQTAIAAVLSDMDAELAVLEERREKTRQLKQGMMQELLTGRTRLV